MYLRKNEIRFSKTKSLYNFCLFFAVGVAYLPLSDGSICQFLQNEGAFVNDECTIRCGCTNDVFDCNFNYRCDQNAECREENGVKGCVCIDGYHGDGETCTPAQVYTDCYDAYEAGKRADGIYTIRPRDWPFRPFEVLCDMTGNTGGWTVFQRRGDGETEFYRDWSSYKYGFGSFNGDFWLGNEKLYYLTNQRNYELQIDMVTSENYQVSQTYPSFSIGTESENYRLALDRGNSRTGMYFNTGRYFSTFDRDNDRCSVYNCAQKHLGGWWYGGARSWCTSCYGRHCSNFVSGYCSTACTDSNLNGAYDGENGQSIIWYRNAADRYCNMKYANMKIRPSL